jgi:hypothetical protein
MCKVEYYTREMKCGWRVLYAVGEKEFNVVGKNTSH